MFGSYSDSHSYATCQICGARLDKARYGPFAWYCDRHEGGIDERDGKGADENKKTQSR